ncbi:MAG: hypothetical protein Q4C91_14245, partial [Eubacteriales bacterium]|nr:hypothetical protein [Eubacteriales bacterium]
WILSQKRKSPVPHTRSPAHANPEEDGRIKIFRLLGQKPELCITQIIQKLQLLLYFILSNAFTWQQKRFCFFPKPPVQHSHHGGFTASRLRKKPRHK